MILLIRGTAPYDGNDLMRALAFVTPYPTIPLGPPNALLHPKEATQVLQKLTEPSRSIAIDALGRLLAAEAPGAGEARAISSKDLARLATLASMFNDLSPDRIFVDGQPTSDAKAILESVTTPDDWVPRREPAWRAPPARGTAGPVTVTFGESAHSKG